MITFDAHFDGKHLCPEEPVALPLNVRLRVTVVASVAVDADRPSVDDRRQREERHGLFGSIIDEVGLVDGPVDWALELDHYLYGTPKRGDSPAA